MRLKVILNPAAAGGGSVRHLPDIRRWLPGGVHTYEFVIPASRDALLEEAHNAEAEGFEGVLACGGDGTIHDVLIGLNATRLPLGVLPAGRGNDTSRNFDLPHGLEEACKAMRRVKIKAFDLPTANGIPFLSGAYVGFDALVAKLTHDGKCLLGGAICYTWNVVRALVSYRPMILRIELDDTVLEGRYMMATFANGVHYGGGMKIAPAADPRDGLFDVITVDPVNPFTLLRLFPKIFSGQHILVPQVSVHRSRTAKITMLSRGQDVTFSDGEPFVQLPVSLEIEPGGLPLIVPV